VEKRRVKIWLRELVEMRALVTRRRSTWYVVVEKRLPSPMRELITQCAESHAREGRQCICTEACSAWRLQA
jgi:hypothetical protein